MMVGRPVELTVHKDPPQLGEDALVVDNLRVIDALGHVHVDDLSFTIKRGEVLAVAGVQGNGQTELTEALLGLQDHVTGSIKLDGKELVGRSVRKILDAGVGFVPEDRQVDGLVGNMTIAENLMLNRSFDEPFVRNGSLQLDKLDEFAKQKLKEYDVRAPGITTHAGNLSGGNQQKVVVARELSRDLRLLVAAQPTRGVDVGSIEFIHTQIVATRDSGVPVLVVSTELDEVVALADRIMVLYRGRIVGIVPPRHPPRGARPDDDRRASGRGRRMTYPTNEPGPNPTTPAPAEPEPEKPGRRTTTAGARRCARSPRATPPSPSSPCCSRSRVGLAAHHAHRRRRARHVRLRVRATRRLLLGVVGGHLGRLHRPVPRLGLQHPGRGLPDRDPAADRDPQVRRSADRRRTRRGAGVPGRAVQHRWPRPDADGRRGGRLGRLPVRAALADPPDRWRSSSAWPPGRCGAAWSASSRPAPARTR